MTPVFDATPPPELPDRSVTARVNRRRRWVFVGTFLLASVVSLAYVYLRPAQYEASARWQFAFAERDEQPAPQRPAGTNPAFLTQLQVITSRPLLEKLEVELQSRPALLAGPRAADPVDALQQSLRVHPVPGTTIVEVMARGASPEPLAPTINTLFEVYQRQLDESHRANSGHAWVQAQDEADALQKRVAQKRAELDNFRARHNIVSLERDENQVLSQLKGQSGSLNSANEKLVAAESRLKSLRASVASGKAVARARDDPTLAGLEQRLSQAREEVRVMERKFTDAYMRLDPDAKALRTRLANLEEQVRQARSAAQRAALTEAEEELASARAAAERIGQDMTSAQRNVQSFTARLGEYKTMRQELDKLEQQRGAAAARATELELGSRRAAPAVSLLEPATLPTRPAWPHYERDAAIALGGSLLVALLAMGLVELLNRPEPSPTLVMVERGWGALGAAQGARPLPLDTPARALQNAPAPVPVALLEPAPLPRELEETEITRLLGAAGPATRALLMTLLSGVSAEEAAALNWGDVQLSARAMRIGDRVVPMAEPLAALLSRLKKSDVKPDLPVFAGAEGRRPKASDLEGEVGFAAHDAGLAYSNEVRAATLRHTFAAHLARQGARFGDLARWVGRLPPDALGIYTRLAPPGPKRQAEEIDPVLPALRRSYS